MQKTEPIRCRVAACREALGDGKEWGFYLINDNTDPLDLTVLDTIGYEWGDWGNSETTDVRITGLAPGAHALLWRDDGSGAELRMDLSLLVRMRGREVRLRFEFPKLYLKSNLPMVEGLGKPGWQEAAEG
jgi:hypothetical protein